MLNSPKRMTLEALPVAAILLFWNLLAGVAEFQGVAGSVSSAGVVMAALYVVVRGVSLAEQVRPPAMGRVETVLVENARLAVPAGAWFLAAVMAAAVERYVNEVLWLLSPVKTALAGAGLAVVGLYAVAAGYSALGGERAAGGRPHEDCDAPGKGGCAGRSEDRRDDAR
ncbi:hypothetical protein [Halorussus pelagicus]|uniref:hypothetical protein n=1 Tax=Halorussus pelagicus TaxID=2505977 RepID=UPI000FFB5F08|nr:hypothetical protein [Halorussus pelagicus]